MRNTLGGEEQDLTNAEETLRMKHSGSQNADHLCRMRLLCQLFMHSFSELGSKPIFLLNQAIALYSHTAEKHNSVLSCPFS